MNIQLAGKSAWVTGATSGIGAGITRALAVEGVQLVLTARDKDKLGQMADELAASGAQPPVILAADLTCLEGLANLSTKAQQAVGGVDILVNAAGASYPVTMDEPDEHWDEAFALNFTAVRRLTQSVLPLMQARRWGRIINLSGSMEPRHLNAASAAKAALQLWSKSVSCEVASEGITVNCIMPGRITSRQTLVHLHPDPAAREEFIARHIPIGHFGAPEDVASLVTFLASPLARYITGAVIPVDGGMRHFAH
jgi:3-oxoacyl-[acyl-carrier protein] reductase